MNCDATDIAFAAFDKALAAAASAGSADDVGFGTLKDDMLDTGGVAGTGGLAGIGGSAGAGTVLTGGGILASNAACVAVAALPADAIIAELNCDTRNGVTFL